MLEGDSITIGDDDDAGDGAAFVYLRLYENDVGNLQGRASRQEFIERKPFCVAEFTKDGLTLEIANSGQTVSDVIALEYQVVFCTWATHGPQDGFVVSHASESQSDQLEKYLSLDFVAPGESILKRIDFPELGFVFLKNVYFRARVSTLWSPSIPPSNWNFATDPAVTEAHLRFSN